MIVLGTVLLNATTARLFAKVVGVFLVKSEGILIIGASKFSRLMGDYLQKNNRHVVLVDSNLNNVDKTKKLGLEAFSANIYSDSLEDNIELSDIGYLMSLTGNAEINTYAINKFKKQFGEHGSFRLVSSDETNDPENNPKEGLFSHSDDFMKLMETTRKYPAINEIKLRDATHYQSLLEITDADENSIPLFLKDNQGDLKIISAFNKEYNGIEEGFLLVYLGKVFDVEALNNETLEIE